MTQTDKATDVSPVRKQPLGALPRLRSDVGQLFDRRWPSLFDWSRFMELQDSPEPRVDVIDQESDVLVKAELPGFAKEDIDVSVTDHTMTIRASRKEETEQDEDGDYYLREVSRHSIARTLQLPASVDYGKATASCRDGVLEVRLPKLAEAKRRRIAIES